MLLYALRYACGGAVGTANDNSVTQVNTNSRFITSNLLSMPHLKRDDHHHHHRSSIYARVLASMEHTLIHTYESCPDCAGRPVLVARHRK